MDELIILYFFLTFVVLVQSILGVGILVLGTPILLVFEFNIVEIMNMLLPISILTSLLNVLIILNQKNVQKIELNTYQKKTFFLICVPSVFLGLLILKKFESLINFNLMVSIIIILSILLKLYQKKIWLFLNNNFLLKIIMFFMGNIHGLTNSGGTLLVLFFTQSSKGKLDQNRYSVSFFYLFLALFQYLVFKLLFKNISIIEMNELIIISIVIIGTTIGNLSLKYISENKIDKMITIISFVSALSLITKI